VSQARPEFEELLGRVCGEQGWVHDASGIEVKLEDGRRQVVKLDYFEFEGAELVRLYTVIGESRRIHPLRLTQALRVNFGLPHGAMALRGEELVLVDTLIVEDADAGEIEAAVGYLAETGDHFERTLFGPDAH